MGERVLGLGFCGFFSYIYETDISNPIPSQACHHPPLIVHPLPYTPSLTLGTSSRCGKE